MTDKPKQFIGVRCNPHYNNMCLLLTLIDLIRKRKKNNDR